MGRCGRRVGAEGLLEVANEDEHRHTSNKCSNTEGVPGVMEWGYSRKPAICCQQFVDQPVEGIIELNRRYTFGQPLTDIKAMCPSNPSEADCSVPGEAVYKNDLLGLKIEKSACCPVSQPVVRTLIDAPVAYNGY